MYGEPDKPCPYCGAEGVPTEAPGETTVHCWRCTEVLQGLPWVWLRQHSPILAMLVFALAPVVNQVWYSILVMVMLAVAIVVQLDLVAAVRRERGLDSWPT